MLKKYSIQLLAVMAIAGSAQAVTISFSASQSLTSTNWTETLSVSQFDPALGTLNSITIDYNAGVSGEANAESLDATPTVISLDVQAEVEFSNLVGGPTVVLLPAVSVAPPLTAFDGTIDFGGTSGFMSGVQNGSDTDQTVLGPLAGFIGLGTIDFDVEGTGMSTGSGAGNLITQFATSASADVTVTYDYDVPASVPDGGTTVALLGGSLLMLAGARRKLRK